jgi:biopolymer transport protein ExbD
MSFPASKSALKRPRKSRSDKKFKAFKPQLTSMVDAVVLLLIFLLQSFSTEGDIISPSKDLQLPVSSADKTPKVTVVITVNLEYILAENQPVASVNEVLGNDDLLIPGLEAWLKSRRETTEKIAQYSTGTTFTGEVTILGDKRIRFRLLKKILYTCGLQGFNNFYLAVQQKKKA